MSEAVSLTVPVRIGINKLNSGRIQIAVFRDAPNQMTGPVQTYPSAENARKVLLAFGIPSAEIDRNFQALSEIGPKGVLNFTPLEVADEILAAQGFRP